MTRRLDHSRWLIRIVTWDGLFPLCVLLLPMAIRMLFPNNEGAIVFTAIILPIALFFARGYFAFKHIEENHCGEIMRMLQGFALLPALLLLMFIDSILIIMPAPAAGGAIAMPELASCGLMFAGYVLIMGFVLYPGLVEAPDTDYPSSDHHLSIAER